MTDPQPTPSTSDQGWLHALAHNRSRFANLLFVLAFVFALVPMLLAYKHGSEYLAVCLWGGLLTLVALAGGTWLTVQQPAPGSELDLARIQVLTLGGVAGLITSLLLGIGMGWKWWDTVAGGWDSWQGPDGWRVWVTVLALSGGLALMFLSLQLARADERSNAGLRRLLYGYNTALSGLLVFGILLGLNTLAYTSVAPFKYLNQDYRWAAMSIYSLSDKSEKILDSLDKPTKIYVLLPSSGQIYLSMRAFLDNCRYVNPKIDVEYISPDLNPDRVAELEKQYKFSDRFGVLLIYGDEHRFIKADDLVGNPDFSDPNKATLFKGEAALMTELNFLIEGKEKPVLYFTQGNGELDLSDARSEQPDRGMGILKQKLETSNYQVKGLQFSPVDADAKNPNLVRAQAVPKDAAIVVIARPARPFADYALKALRDYLDGKNDSKKKGMLIVLFDVELTPASQMVQTGLEPLLAEYGVAVGNNRLLSVPQARGQSPLTTIGTPPRVANAKGANPLVTAFGRWAFGLYLPRTVEPAKEREQGRYNIDVLLEAAPENQFFWVDSDFAKEPSQVLEDLVRNKQLRGKVSQDARAVAVAVSEAEPGSGPHGFMNTEKKPRLIVFGDASFISNAFLSDRRAGNLFYDYFVSALGWLREKPASIGIEPKKADVFMLNPTTNVLRMLLLPGLIVFLGILGLGAGVWTVRRR